MRHRASSWFSLLLVGPTLVVPIGVWHHHAPCAAVASAGHDCNNDARPERHWADSGTDAPSQIGQSACFLCILANQIKGHELSFDAGPTELKPALDAPGIAYQLPGVRTPLSLRARGPPISLLSI